MKKRIRPSLMPFAMRPDCNVIERKRRGKRVCQCQAKALASKQVPPANEPSPPLSSGLVNHITLIKCACCLVVVPPPLPPDVHCIFEVSSSPVFRMPCHRISACSRCTDGTTLASPSQVQSSQLSCCGSCCMHFRLWLTCL